MSTRLPPWDLFETFLAVMEGGSLSAASRTLKTAQPTIRRRIAALEEALQATLFTRATNGLVPTDAAHGTLVHARSMAAAAQAMVRSTSGGASEPRGTVRVAASEVVGTHLLPTMLAPLMKRWPELQVELVVSNKVEDLLRRDADVAVRMGRPTQAALVARRCGTVPVALFAHRQYLAAHGRPKRLADLSAHRLVGGDSQRPLHEFLAAAGAKLTSRHFVLRSDDDVVQVAAVRAGLGIGPVQVPLAAGWPDLERVLPRFSVPLETWLVMHEDLRAVKRVRLVFDHLLTSMTAYLAGEKALPR